MIARLAALALLIGLAAPAGANHYPNHTCGLFPRDGNPRTAGVGFGTPEAGAVGSTDQVIVVVECLSLDTHEAFTAYLEITFQRLERGAWVDGPSVGCRATSNGRARIQSVTLAAPGTCPNSHSYRPGDPGAELPHRARLHVWTNVRNGPDIGGHTNPWGGRTTVAAPAVTLAS